MSRLLKVSRLKRKATEQITPTIRSLDHKVITKYVSTKGERAEISYVDSNSKDIRGFYVFYDNNTYDFVKATNPAMTFFQKAENFLIKYLNRDDKVSINRNIVSEELLNPKNSRTWEKFEKSFEIFLTKEEINEFIQKQFESELIVDLDDQSKELIRSMIDEEISQRKEITEEELQEIIDQVVEEVYLQIGEQEEENEEEIKDDVEEVEEIPKSVEMMLHYRKDLEDKVDEFIGELLGEDLVYDYQFIPELVGSKVNKRMINNMRKSKLSKNIRVLVAASWIDVINENPIFKNCEVLASYMIEPINVEHSNYAVDTNMKTLDSSGPPNSFIVKYTGENNDEQAQYVVIPYDYIYNGLVTNEQGIPLLFTKLVKEESLESYPTFAQAEESLLQSVPQITYKIVPDNINYQEVKFSEPWKIHDAKIWEQYQENGKIDNNIIHHKKNLKTYSDKISLWISVKNDEQVIERINNFAYENEIFIEYSKNKH